MKAYADVSIIRRSRPLRLVALLSTTALAATACGSSPAATTSSSASTGKAVSPVVLSVPNDKATWATWFNQIGSLVGKADGGISFKSRPYATTSAYQAVMDQLVTSPKAPAVFTWWSGQQLRLLVNEHAAANLTPEVQNWIAKYGLNKEVMSAYKVNGKYYGVPMYEAYWPVFYNKAVFAKYHLSPPTTWAQLVNVADTLKSHGVTPFAQLVGGWTGFIWFENLLINMNPSLYQKLVNGKASYLNPGIVKVMKFWSSLQADGWFKQFSGTAANSGANRAFANGTVAMMLIGSWDEPTMISRGIKPGSGFGAFVMPPIAKGLGDHMIFETGPFVVSSKSPQRAAALKAMNTFMEPAIQTKWSRLTNFVSPESSVPASNKVNTALATSVAKGKITLLNRYWESTPPQIAVAASSELNKEMIDPQSYMAVLRDIQSRIAGPYWKAHKAPVG